MLHTTLKLYSTEIFYKNYFKIIKNILYRLSLPLKHFYTLKFKTEKTTSHFYSQNIQHKYKKILHKHFYTYVNLGVFSQKTALKPHHTFSNLFIKSGKNGTTCLINIPKFYNKYTHTLTFIMDIYRYNLNLVFFGNSFLKNEIFALNWNTSSRVKIRLRLSQLLIFVTPVSRSNISVKILNRLNLFSRINAFVLDTIYHQTTLTFFSKLPILTVGIVPILYSSKSLDISIPVTVDSVFTQLFFVKLVCQLRRSIENINFQEYKQLYTNFTNLY